MPSTAYNKSVNALSSSEVPIVLVEIHHVDLQDPIYLVSDNQDVTSNGQVYQRMALGVTLPTQPETGASSAKLSIDNVTNLISPYIEQTNGAHGATVKMKQILRSDPNTIEWEVEMDLTNITLTPQTMTADLSFAELLGVPCVNFAFSPARAPGLF